MVRGQHVREGLVRASQILLDSDVVLDLVENDWGGDEQGEDEQAPVTSELGEEGDLLAIERPHDGCTGRLDALVEADVIGRATARVGERTHEPGRFVSMGECKG